MRITNNLSKNSKNSYCQNLPSFGAVYTKSSVKLLKNSIPDMILEDGFEFAQKAINNLAQTGKRKDNLVLKFKDADQLGIGRLEVHAKHLSDKYNSFSKIDIPVEAIGKKESQVFEQLASFVNSDSFVSKSNIALDVNEKLSRPQKLRRFVSEKLNDLTQKVLNKAESIAEEVYTIDESGSKRKWAILADIQDLFSKNKNPYQYNDKQKEEAKILARMLDNLPTYSK